MRDETNHSPWVERLSDYVDGDLAVDERRALWQHLAECDSCPATLEELRGVRDAATRLAFQDPPRDLWPGIASELPARSTPSRADDEHHGETARGVRAPRLLLGLAAGVLIAWTIALWLRDDAVTPGGPVRDAGLSRFLLLLHEDPVELAQLPPDELGGLVNEYRTWSREVAAEGRLLSGEKLVDDRGFWLEADVEPHRGVEGAEVIGGYFLIQAEDYAAANAIAESCPHRNYGKIEVRKLEELK